MSVVIECSKVRKVYRGPVEALRGIDLCISRGECFGLLGRNGSGKTTTVEIIEGLLAPTSGCVRIFGKKWAQAAAEIRPRIGAVLQGARLPDKLTVRETLRLFASFYPRPMSVEEALRRLELNRLADTRAGVLSEGQRQCLNLACGLIGGPELLFLDEPTTGLDPHSREKLWATVSDYCGSGGTVLFTTHYMEEAERFGTYIAILDQGLIVAQGTPADLVSRLGAGDVVEISTGRGSLTEWAAEDLSTMPGVVSVREVTHGWQLLVNNTELVVQALMDAARLRGRSGLKLTTREISLDDVFISIAGRGFRNE